MTTKLQDAEQRFASLATKSHNVVTDSRPWASKAAEWQAIEADIKAMTPELEALRGADKNLTAVALGGDLVEWADGPSGRSSAGYAPPLNFSREQIAELRGAAEDRKTISVKAAISSTESPMGTAPDYRTTPFPFLRDRARILDLIPIEQTGAPQINYYRASAGATAADTVAEGANKPESSPAWESVIAPVRKIAHFVRVNDEVISDDGQFMQTIGVEMLGGLITAENEQILTGSGVAPDLTGLLSTSGIIVRAKGADSALDALFLAGNDLRTGSCFCEPTVVVMHPANLGSVVLSKDTTGAYYAGGPFTEGAKSLWGIPVLATTAIAAGTAMVANLAEAAKVYLREGPRLEVNPLGGAAEFIANQTLIRAEERLALAVQRPTAIVKVTGL